MNSKVKHTPTLVVEFNWDEISALAGATDWLWRAFVENSDDAVVGARPKVATELYWTLRDTWRNHVDEQS